jgi:DNA-binding IclR family transcriptional regulator
VKERVQSVERAIDVMLGLVAGPRTLTEVCRQTGLSKGTAFRLLASLGHQGVVVKDGTPNAVYMLGPGLLRLVQGVMQGLGSVGAVARPAALELWRQTEETVILHVRVGFDRVCVEEIPSPHPIRYTAGVGSVAPLHVGSAGKVLLGALEPDELDRLMPFLPLARITEHTVTDLRTLRRQVAAVRRRGWAISAGERVIGAAAISVPVRSGDGLAAALSVLGPITRLPRKRLDELAGKLQATAAEIEEALASTRHPQLQEKRA